VALPPFNRAILPGIPHLGPGGAAAQFAPAKDTGGDLCVRTLAARLRALNDCLLTGAILAGDGLGDAGYAVDDLLRCKSSGAALASVLTDAARRPAAIERQRAASATG